jgi:predicted nucleic acid-binding protein
MIIVNASPLICLARAEMLYILRELFVKIAIPRAVESEILTGPVDDPMRKILETEHPPWIKTVELETDTSRLISWQLGPGEAEVLELAMLDKNSIAILDDKLARFYAKRLGMKVKGTLSLVLMAFRKGIISDGVEAMKKLRDSGLWISDKLFEGMVKEVKGVDPSTV